MVFSPTSNGIGVPGPIQTQLIPIQPPTNAPGRAAEAGPCLPCESWMEFWLLLPLGSEPAGGRSLSAFLSLYLSNEYNKS